MVSAIILHSRVITITLMIMGLVLNVTAIWKRKDNKIIHKISIFFKIESPALVALYMIVNKPIYKEFLRKLLVIYLPIIQSVFAQPRSLHPKVFTLTEISAEIAIFHTEIENKNDIIVLFAYLLYLSSHFLAYFLYFKGHKKIYLFEKQFNNYESVLFYIYIVSLIYWLIIYFVMNQGLIFKMLTFVFLIVFLVFPFIFHENLIVPLIFCISMSMIIYSVLTYIENRMILTITSILMSMILLILPYLIESRYLKDEIIVNDDLYLITEDRKAVWLLRKSCSNQIIKNDIIYEGKTFKIVSFSPDCMDDYCNNELEIANSLFINRHLRNSDNICHLKKITVSYDICLIDLTILLESNNDHIVVMIHGYTNFVLNENRIFSKNFGLYYVKKCSRRLFINEPCRFIRSYACKDCKMLTKIIFPDSLVEIGDYAFSNCERLREIRFNRDSQLKSIGQVAFSISELRFVKFPKKLIKIGRDAFRPCDKLEKVVFPTGSLMDTLNVIFFGRNTSVIIPESIRLPNSNNFSVKKLANKRRVVTLCHHYK